MEKTNQFKTQVRRVNRTALLIGGGLLALLSSFLRIFGGSPHTAIHAIGAEQIIPPVWLVGLLGLCATFLLGAAAGIVFSDTCGGNARAVWRFRGGMYFILAVVMVAGWYLLLFRALSLWLSLLLLLLGLATGIVCTICWARVKLLSCFMSGVFCLWVLWVFILQLAAVLQA